MFASKRLLTLLSVALLAAQVASAQDAPEKELPARIKPTAVLSRIPADAMGFIVVNNVHGLGGKVDRFLQDISPPGQPLMPGPVVDMLQGQMQMQKGFNVNAPFAAVMLDPQEYGVDLLEMMPKPPAGMGAPAAEPAGKDQIPPVLLMIPAKDIDTLLAAHNPQKVGGLLKTDGGMFWKQHGDFVVGSPLKEALAAVDEVKRPAGKHLSLPDQIFLAKNDATMWLNMKVAGPIVLAAMKQGQEQMRQSSPVEAATMDWYFDVYRDMLGQMEDMAIGLQMTRPGILGQMRASFKPDSKLGKALKSAKAVKGRLLDRIPSSDYIFAMGMRMQPGLWTDWNRQMFEQMFQGEQGPMKLTEEQQAKLKKVSDVFTEQTTAVQFFMGGNDTGVGQVGMAYVLEGKSAGELRGAMVDYVGVLGPMFKQMGQQNAAGGPDMSQLSLKYHKNAATAGDGKVDVIKIEHPGMAEMSDEERNQMKTVLGESDLRVLVGEVDKKTLLATFGGGTAFYEHAAKIAAKNSGDIPEDVNTRKALAMLPKDRQGVFLFHVGNILPLVKKISAAMGEQAPPIQMPAPVPFAGSYSMDKSDLVMTGYIPTESVKGIAQNLMPMFMMMMMQGGGMGPGAMPPGPPAPPPGGF